MLILRDHPAASCPQRSQITKPDDKLAAVEANLCR